MTQSADNLEAGSTSYTADAIYEVLPLDRPPHAAVSVPGSKSQTNRALLLAALADGRSTLSGALFSDDSGVFVDSLRRLGFTVGTDEAAATIEVTGLAGRIPAAEAELYVGNAGTAARFLTAFLSLGHGSYLLDGTPRMRQRPIGELLDALRELGADLEPVQDNGCLPVRVRAAGLRGGDVTVDASRSGQFLSALLMVASYADRDVAVRLAGPVASPPYIAMTLSMMAQWGIEIEQLDQDSYLARAGGRYQARAYDVPPEASGASYFLAAAAITGGTVCVRNLGLAVEQGDLGFLEVLERMGCRVRREGTDIEVTGPERLSGIDLDLNAMSDMTMTLAAIAPFADGPVIIRNVGHIREQESDRLAATAAELRRLGAQVDEWADGLAIKPSALHGANVHTYDDHRMAMAFALPGLVVPGVRIENPGCVAKTFPDYFARLESLRGRD
jgi:3-phosphoshikimate 1-carboxyvinyltransferase